MSFYREHQRVPFVTKGESMALQSEKDTCDVNRIMKRYRETGQLDHMAKRQPYYADVSDALEYQEALHVVGEAQEAFEALPASLRRRFDNDPAEMLTFLQDPANEDEARELGLLPKKAPERAPDAGPGSGQVPGPVPPEPSPEPPQSGGGGS